MLLIRRSPTRERNIAFAIAAMILAPIVGCGPSFHQLRTEGEQAMIAGAYGPARILFQQAEDVKPRRAENLFDLGMCSVMRELDEAVDYFNSSIDAHPGFMPSIEGKTMALELRGQLDEALKNAEWAATFVGPSAKQYMFLARELEQRGDVDGAMLRYRQAVALEPNNASVHIAFAKFLLRHGNEEATVYHLQAAYRIDPTNTWVTSELARRGAIPALASDRSAEPAKP
jgi:tetratricopeptide (TPR) repeat protein